MYCLLLLNQVAAARDISRSSIDNGLGCSHSRRLLRLKLTDGHTEIIAIEYSTIPSLQDDIIPGTKVSSDLCTFLRYVVFLY